MVCNVPFRANAAAEAILNEYEKEAEAYLELFKVRCLHNGMDYSTQQKICFAGHYNYLTRVGRNVLGWF